MLLLLHFLCLLLYCLQVPVKKHHILPLKIAGAVAKAFLANMESEDKQHHETEVNVVEEVEYVPTPVPVPVPAPAPVVASVPTFTVNETVHGTMGWSG
jgi:hypothetical protein